MLLQRNIHWNVCLFIMWIYLGCKFVWIFEWTSLCICSKYCKLYITQNFFPEFFSPKFRVCYTWVHIITGPLAKWVECSPIVQETRVQSQVESYQRLKNMVLDAALLNTQHYKVSIKGKVEKSREWSSTLSYTSV